MDKLKQEAAAYMLFYLSAYEKLNCIFNFFYSLLPMKDGEVIYYDCGEYKLEIDDKKSLCELYEKSGVLTNKQMKKIKEFTDNRNDIAHEVWKIKVAYGKDYLKFKEIIVCIIGIIENKFNLFEEYNKLVEKGNEKINVIKIFESIKLDAEVLLDEVKYKDILDILQHNSFVK